MEALFGPQLIGKDGEIPTASAFAGKRAIGIYFSAHWCPPCRGFTPKLAEFYTKSLKDKGLEIVFCSSDKDDATFKSYFGEQPWLAIPWDKRDVKTALDKKFKVAGIPALIIVDTDGNLITKDGRGAVMKDPEGAEFPWKPKSMAEIMDGASFLRQGQKIDAKAAFENKKAIGLYFSAHWCPPCRAFTPKLAGYYTEDLKAKGLEIVFISSDRDEGAFNDYYGEQPWLALEFSDRARKEQLSGACKVEGIPSLVIIDPSDYSIINLEGREAVSGDPKGDELPWKPKAVKDLANGPGQINECPTVIIFCEAAADSEKEAILAAVTPLAEKYLDEAKAKGEDVPDISFMLSKVSSGLGNRIRGMTSLKSLPPQPHNHAMKEMAGDQAGWGCDGCNQSGAGKKRFRCAEGCDFDFCGECYEKTNAGSAETLDKSINAMVILDTQSGGAYFVAPTAEFTAASIESFVNSFKAGSLERKQLS